MRSLFQHLLLLLLALQVQPDNLRSQIIGGREAKPHSRPYMAALKMHGQFGCGGFLVAPQWVMTAAHCMSEMTVILGAHDLYDVEESQQVLGVESYHMHPDYNSYLTDNDILLLKLVSKATLNKYVQTVPLPQSSSDLPGGVPCSLAGWGLIDQEHVTEKLYEVNVTIYNRKQCMKFYPDLKDGMICAGSYNQLRDTSQINYVDVGVLGEEIPSITVIYLDVTLDPWNTLTSSEGLQEGDSGGPMVCNGVVHGIVSFGNHFPPGVYTRIAKYLPWIKKTMESDQ